MTLKKALFYTIANPWRGDHKIMAVTSEKRSQYFGRFTEDNSGTHVRKQDCRGRFDTEADARARLTAVQAVRARHRPIRKACEEASTAAWCAEETDVERAIKGEIDG